MKRSNTQQLTYNHLPHESQRNHHVCHKSLRARGHREETSEESSTKDEEDTSEVYTEESEESSTAEMRFRREVQQMRELALMEARNRKHHHQQQQPQQPQQQQQQQQQQQHNDNSDFFNPRHVEPVLKKDKVTQKNLISPTPSYLSPSYRSGLISDLKNMATTGKTSDNNNSINNGKFKRNVNEESVEDDNLCYHHQNYPHSHDNPGQNRKACGRGNRPQSAGVADSNGKSTEPGKGVGDNSSWNRIRFNQVDNQTPKTAPASQRQAKKDPNEMGKCPQYALNQQNCCEETAPKPPPCFRVETDSPIRKCPGTGKGQGLGEGTMNNKYGPDVTGREDYARSMPSPECVQTLGGYQRDDRRDGHEGQPNRHTHYVKAATAPGHVRTRTSPTAVAPDNQKCPAADMGARPASANAAGRPTEKLVYVVEEEGKEPSKLETDLFTVNEILAIKKDLLELSEFAKKLKKLKEMKKESDKDKRDKSCPCTPATDLLKDVNRRIELLEARQEELEKGGGLRGGGECEIIKVEDTTPNEEATNLVPSNEPSVSQSSQPSDTCKQNIAASKPETTGTNSEIVNELMDIKTQLRKLQKRKKTKELNQQPQCVTAKIPSNKKGHSIAVYSSRTYILTSPNANADPTAASPDDGGGGGGRAFETRMIAAVEGKLTGGTEDKVWKSKSQKTKESVANWLRTIQPQSKPSENDLTCVPGEGFKEKCRHKDKPSKPHDRCRKCNKSLKNDELEYQFPPRPSTCM